MKQWVVLSGKGGTGKTSVAAALAHLAAGELRIVLADADVDAANLELLLSPEILESEPFVGGQVAEIEPAACTGCGVCAEVCRFEAVLPENGIYRVDSIACEGCAACAYACPADAIRMLDQVNGRWMRSQSGLGPLFHARLFAGQENSGKLVTQVRQRAALAAHESSADLLLIDGPPGIGCPVIAACAGTDLALLVTEPSVSGVHDLKRVLGVLRHFDVPALVCVNKADINPARTEEVVHLCAEEKIPMVGTIPFDPAVPQAMARRQPITAYDDGAASRALAELWRELLPRLSS